MADNNHVPARSSSRKQRNGAVMQQMEDLKREFLDF